MEVLYKYKKIYVEFGIKVQLKLLNGFFESVVCGACFVQVFQDARLFEIELNVVT